MVQLEQYRFFAAVAKNKSFCRAAEELFVTQPAISQAIKQLENRLGTQLFIRSSRGVTLTQAGNTLYSYVSQAMSIFDNAENHIKSLQTLECGTLYIGAGDTLCHHYLLPFLNVFKNKYPGVSLKVTNRTSQETVRLLKEGKVDIGFVNLPTDLDEQIAVRPLKMLHDCFVYNEKYFKLDKIDSLEALSELPILMLERESSTRRYIDNYCKTNNIVLNPQIELGSHDLLLSFAEIGIGIAAVVKEYSKDYLINNRLKEIKLKNNIPPRSIGLIYQKKIPLTFSAKEFIGLL